MALQPVNGFTPRDTAVYRLAKSLVGEVLLESAHDYDTPIERLFRDARELLQIEVEPIENQYVVTFVIDKGEVDASITP